MALSRSLRAFAGFAVVAAVVSTAPSAALDRTPASSSGLSLLGAGDDPVMRPTVSADGRYVAFHTEEGFLVQGDTNGFSDVFVHDRVTDEIELISRSAFHQGNGGSSYANISDDGRFVTFHSQATVLVDGDDNEQWDVFLYDRTTEAMELVSATDGDQANGSSYFPSVSGDGRYVVFHSEATNFSPDDTDSTSDVYVKDRVTGNVELISAGIDGGSGDGESHVPQISADGRYVVFESAATNLVADDDNDKYDIFLYDRDNDSMERISLSAESLDADDNSFLPQITPDGRYVAYESYASNIVVGDGNEAGDVFVLDRWTDFTVRVSTSFNGTVEPDDRALAVSISDDGQRIAYHSWAANLIGGDTNEQVDSFLYTMGDAGPIRISGGETEADGPSVLPVISGDGSVVVFESLTTNLDAEDDDTFWDVYAYVVSTDELSSITPTAAESADNAWWKEDFPETGFTDIVPGAYYEDGVSFLRANGITNGTGPDSFSPNRLVNRAEMVTFLFRLGGSQWPTTGSPFIDVPEESWFLEPVKWAYENEITRGTSDTTFSPYASVTRAQMAMFLWRLAGQPDVDTPHGFVDVDTETWYEPAVRWLKDAGITVGTSPDEFSPEGSVTRGQMATFLYRLVVEYGWVPIWEAIDEATE